MEDKKPSKSRMEMIKEKLQSFPSKIKQAVSTQDKTLNSNIGAKVQAKFNQAKESINNYYTTAKNFTHKQISKTSAYTTNAYVHFNMTSRVL